MRKKEEKRIKKIIIDILFTIVGAFIMAIGVSLFLLPNHLSSGGVAGIATIIYYLFNMSMGTTILIINIPLFLMSRKIFFNKINCRDNIFIFIY